LEEFDRGLTGILEALGPDDILFITADHGNDPSTASTDHSRERTPVLVAGPRVAGGTSLGERATFCDLGVTVAALLEVATSAPGESFAELLLS
jgi:phosphopentomutase